MQVLLVAAILAGIATMLLRASLSRTVSARKARVEVTAQALIESCMAEVNALWAAKTDEAFKRDYDEGNMYCKVSPAAHPDFCNSAFGSYKCSIPVDFDGGGTTTFEVTATIDRETEPKEITYEITKGGEFL